MPERLSAVVDDLECSAHRHRDASTTGHTVTSTHAGGTGCDGGGQCLDPTAADKNVGCLSQGGLPDPACTPGAVDPRVSQSNINSTICTRGYTATVRPPVSVTEPIKRERMTAYGLQGQRLADVELDHDIPLELGGNPQDLANLWPQFWNGEANAHLKDAVETYLNHEVCRGGMPLAEAQRQIATDWLSVYRSRGLSPAQ